LELAELDPNQGDRLEVLLVLEVKVLEEEMVAEVLAALPSRPRTHLRET
jgi:hypothetical protein